MSAIDRVRASWAPDQVQHTTNRWANALAGTGGLRQHVTGMTRKALALDYTPQEWLADILEVAARAAEQFEDVAPGHALAFDYDDEAESSGPLYATMEGEDVNGLFQLSLKPTPSSPARRCGKAPMEGQGIPGSGQGSARGRTAARPESGISPARQIRGGIQSR